MDDTVVWVVLLLLIFLIPVAATLIWAGFNPPRGEGYTKVGAPEAAQPLQEDPTSVVARAELAAVDWLVESDAGAYVACWQRSTELLRTRIAVLAWEQQMLGVRTPLGAVQLRALQSAEFIESLPGSPVGRYVVVQFKTQFKYKESAIEVVTLQQEADGVWRVVGYFIR